MSNYSSFIFEKTIPAPSHWIILVSLLKTNGTKLYEFISRFFILFRSLICLPLCQYCSVLSVLGLQLVNLQVKLYKSPNMVLFQKSLGYSMFFVFLYQFWIHFSMYSYKPSGILYDSMMNLEINFRRLTILTILSPVIYKNGFSLI